MTPGEIAAQHFYRFVREERLFCATLAHLLMQRGPNLGKFLRLVNGRLPEGSCLPTTRLEEAQVYVEFTFLRDSWNLLGKNNDEKRERIFTLLSRVPGLGHYKSECFPNTIPEFNAFFLGSRGAKIVSDIVYPGRWSVSTLFERFGKNREEFRNFCRFKWSFNIKPDMVVLLAGSEAALYRSQTGESRRVVSLECPGTCHLRKLVRAGKGTRSPDRAAAVYV